MVNLNRLIAEVMSEGYNRLNAEARVCQDIVLKAISESSFCNHITVKGGVVMRGISGDSRRATQDMDLDFIRYSLDDDSIQRFISRLNCIPGIRITIQGDIEELSQQEHHGKRVHILLTDESGYSLISKIDLGVHKHVEIQQDEYCFDVCMDDEGASLLINTREQIFTEKLKSLLRFGALSTHYKDIFDMCYLSEQLEPSRLMTCIDTYILSSPDMRENNASAIRTRVHRTFSDRFYIQRLSRSRSANWMDIKPIDALNRIEEFLEKL